MCIRDSLVLAPHNDRYHFALGAIYDELEQDELCIQHMRKAIKLTPNNAAALKYLGYTRAEQGIMLDDAEQLIRRALAIEPNEGFYIDSLGWVYYQRGDYSKAIEHLERAVELIDADPTLIEHLGDAYTKLGRTSDARRLYEEAIKNSSEQSQMDRIGEKIKDLTRLQLQEDQDVQAH